MLTERGLTRQEVPSIWAIDRREVIENFYRVQDRQLILEPEHCEVNGWPPADIELYTPLLLDCFDHGGWFHGLFDGEYLVGIAVLESRFIGPHRDLLQLKELYVGNGHRDQGLGRRLFERTKAEARKRGARGLYVSATPSEHTVNFYLATGCRLSTHPDADLLALEPEDIHLECLL